MGYTAEPQTLFAPGTLPIATREARLLLARSTSMRERRLFVSLSVEDRPGVIRALTDFLRSPGDALDAIGGFNIEASLWGSLSGVGTANFVLEPFPTPGAGFDFDADQERVASGLRKWLETSFVDTFGIAPLRQPQVSWISPGPESALFADRTLGEFRFGIPWTAAHRPARPDRDAARLFALLLAQLSAELGDSGSPICYAFLPASWTEHRPRNEDPPRDELWIRDCWWLRVGFGISELDRAAYGRLQIRARLIAQQHGVGFAVYEPDFWSVQRETGATDLMAHHFVPMRDPDDRGASASEAVELNGRVVTGVARTGLIADLLRGAEASATQLELYGVAMGVLYGHTLAHFVVGRDQGVEIARAVDTLVTAGRRPDAAHPDDESLGTEPFNVVGPGFTGRPDRAVFWIGWRYLEAPGILDTLVSSVHAFIRARAKATDEEEDIHYEVSRVLELGSTCAGKAQFLVSSELAVQLWGGDDHQVDQTAFGRELRDHLVAQLESLAPIDNWHVPPACEEWKRNPVVVTHGEPAAEPWARLSLLAGAPIITEERPPPAEPSEHSDQGTTSQ